MSDTDQAIIEAAITAGTCPQCGGTLGYPSRGGSMLNQDQFEAVASKKYCRRCGRCFEPLCRHCGPVKLTR